MSPFDPRGYLTLARELAGRQDEAAHRSAVSRAYYAALLAAKPVAKKFGVFLKAGNHEAFWEELRLKLKDVGEIGYDLRRWRNNADYSLDSVPDGEWRATYWVGRAQELIRRLDDSEQAICRAVERKRDKELFIKRYYAAHDINPPRPGLPAR